MDLLGIENFELFVITSILLIISPGIDTMLVLNRSISNGRGIGLTCTLGIVTGILIHTLFGVLGISVLISKAAYLFSVLKLIGAAYLLYLGITKLVRKPKGERTDRIKSAISYKRSFLSGMVTNVFNPKVALFFLAFFPQFINTSSESVGLTFLTMGIVFSIMTLVWLTLITLLVAYFSKFFLKSPKAMKVVDKLSGLVFVLLGIKLAFSSKD